VTGAEALGAYLLLRVSDGGGPPPEPGQFAMIACEERWGGGRDERPFLPRAFSIARHRDGEWHFLLEAVGPGTARLAELRPGDGLWTLGPLGRGFTPPPDGRRAVLVGGGVGIAPLAILQDSLAGGVVAIAGFRDAGRAAGAALLAGATVATDDGSVGHRGLVTELLEAELERDGDAVVYACGPAPMLEGVRSLCERTATPAQLALEAAMACGFGACFGCAVPLRGGGFLRTCLDGPVVDAGLLERVEEHAGSPA
jgi:NAD(P)H-flavin reductase